MATFTPLKKGSDEGTIVAVAGGVRRRFNRPPVRDMNLSGSVKSGVFCPVILTLFTDKYRLGHRCFAAKKVAERTKNPLPESPEIFPLSPDRERFFSVVSG